LRLSNEVTLEDAKNAIDKVRATETLLQFEITSHQPARALNIARETLKELGINLPEKATIIHVAANLAHIRIKLTRKRRDRILQMQAMSDPRLIAAMKILARAASAAYIIDQNMFAVIVFKTIALSLKYGNAPASAFAYATYGLLQCGVVGDINYGYSFAKISTSLLEKLHAQKLTANIAVVCGFMRPWKEHVATTLDGLLDAYHKGLEYGDLEFSSIAAFMYCNHAYCSGRNLVELETHMRKTAGLLEQIKQPLGIQINAIYWQVVQNFMGLSSDPAKLIGEAYDEQKSLPKHMQAGENSAICVAYLQKMLLSYTFGNIDEAFSILTLCRSYIQGMQGTYGIPIFNFYESLIRISLLKNSGWPGRIIHKFFILVNQFQMKRWSRHAPVNYMNKWLLVEAERARASGRPLQAQQLYDKSIEAARSSEFIQEEALTFELAAKFYLEQGHNIIAQAYITKAWFLNKQWGASGKVKQIEENYPNLVRQRNAKSSMQQTRTYTTTGKSKVSINRQATDIITSDNNKQIDVDSLLKAAQAISSEIKLESLLDSVLKTIVENSGAENCILILKERGKNDLQLRARLYSQNSSIIHYAANEYYNYEMIPTGIINLVHRTKKPMVVFDASRDQNLGDDPYISKNKPCSLLCCPILRQGELMGIIYAENNLAAGFFTPARVDIVQMLGAQVAVAIDNALLYQNLERKVEERTARLKEKTDNINSMLQNLNQGIFTIVSGGIIHPEYSKHLETILETSEIRFMDVGRLLFSNTNLSSEEIAKTVSTLIFVLEQSSVSYIMNSHLLIRECHKRMPDGRVKILEIDWSPIENEDEIIERMMVTVRDVTLVRELMTRTREQQRQLSIIGQILAVSENIFSNFIENVRRYLKECHELSESAETADNDESLKAMFRHMHTIKGNARMLNFSYICEMAHEAESLLMRYRDKTSIFKTADANLALRDVEKLVDEYEEIFQTKLSRRFAKDSSADDMVILKRLEHTGHALDKGSISSEEAICIYRQLSDALMSSTLESILAQPKKGACQLAGKLDKPQPVIECDDGGVRFSASITTQISDILAHALTNAVDHGIETPEERLRLGKQLSGSIKIILERTESHYLLKITDDGRGINLTEIKRHAESLGMNRDEIEKLDTAGILGLIFYNGLSTARQVTEISGRGIGMDAIRQLARDFGGEAAIAPADSTTKSNFISFSLHITIPGRHLTDVASLMRGIEKSRKAA
ncbi:MAG: GAF domain-containing protein, partial [Oligoflexales bacterium]|nr:GAF domain-containing protein [Oligoflexales bacterium]